jgi:AraC family transcriptional regulator
MKMMQVPTIDNINPQCARTHPQRLPSRLSAGPKGELLGEFSVPVASQLVAEWEHGRGQVLILAGDKPCEMEFLLPFHLALMLPDGSSASWEWSNGARFQVIRSLGAGAILFNPAREYLRVRKVGRDRCRVVLIAINPESMNQIDGIDVDVPQVKFRQEINFHDESVHRTLSTIQAEIENPGRNAIFCCNVLTLLLLTKLIGVASNFAQPACRSLAKGGLPNWRLNRALEMMNRNVSTSPTLIDLADDVGLHPSTFCRAFKQSTGISPGRYLVQLRVTRAKEMMADRSLTLTRIALDCGFSSSSTFSVAFRRNTGLAPRLYRKSL